MKLIFRVCALLIISSVLIYILFYYHSTNQRLFHDSTKTNLYYLPNESYCPIPQFSDKSIEHVEHVKECNHEYIDWISVTNNIAVFNQSATKTLGHIDCFYKNIAWNTDFLSSVDEFWKPFKENTYLGSLIWLVRCKGRSMFDYYEQILFGFDDKKGRSPKNYFRDILIVGIDSVSRLAWKRHLSQTHTFLENNMTSSTVIFKKTNVIGDGTTAHVLGVLAGELETEVYESRTGYPDAKPIDGYPWIWKLLNRDMYSTYFDEDDVTFGSLQYRLMGFLKQPTDFYGRIWRMLRNKRKHSRLCMNHRDIFQDQMYTVRRFYENIKSPKFVFTWSSFFSHDSNDNVAVLDKTLLALLQEVQRPDSLFNNTFLVLMSDHGHRFDSRLKLQGKIEERLPFLAIHLPPSLIEERPSLLKNMKSNENKLITVLDVYETMKDLINNFTRNHTSQSDVHKMSLFSVHLPQRNCSQVKIAAHWCSCLRWTEVNLNSAIITDAAKYTVDAINNVFIDYKELCHHLELDHVLRAHLVSPSKEVLQFYASDKDGRIPYMSDNMKIDNSYYRISFRTKPGDAIFETTINVKMIGTVPEFSLNKANIDRSNQYMNWVSCLKTGMKDIRKYCLCK